MVVKIAKAKELPKQIVPQVCEKHRAIVEKYFGADTDTALFVASKESGCDMAAVSRTQDYCIFQINKEPATGTDINLCVRRAYEKFSSTHTWIQWYAVCTPKTHLPKYAGIKCGNK